MKYICLVYHEEKKLDALSPAALDVLMGECGAWVEGLEEGGRNVFSAALQSVRTAKTVRDRDGKPAVTDGPFAETKGFLGGFTIFDATDLNEAIRLASQSPAARLGTIEVRPVLDPDLELTDSLDKKLGAALRRTSHRKQREPP
jgi:hypothetical protein